MRKDEVNLYGLVAQLLFNGETHKSQAPSGSSTGSAMGVAAEFSPISIGTETSGSLTSSASRAALYALKLTPGSVSMSGTWQVAASFDTTGGMAKTVVDLAHLSDTLLQQRHPAKESLVNAMQQDWEGISVGFVDIELWRLPPEARDDVPGYNERTVRLLRCLLLSSCFYSNNLTAFRPENTLWSFNGFNS